MNYLAFWKSLQEYNAYFFADSLNPSLLSRKARVRKMIKILFLLNKSIFGSYLKSDTPSEQRRVGGHTDV